MVAKPSPVPVPSVTPLAPPLRNVPATTPVSVDPSPPIVPTSVPVVPHTVPAAPPAPFVPGSSRTASQEVTGSPTKKAVLVTVQQGTLEPAPVAPTQLVPLTVPVDPSSSAGHPPLGSTVTPVGPPLRRVTLPSSLTLPSVLARLSAHYDCEDSSESGSSSTDEAERLTGSHRTGNTASGGLSAEAVGLIHNIQAVCRHTSRDVPASVEDVLRLTFRSLRTGDRMQGILHGLRESIQIPSDRDDGDFPPDSSVLSRGTKRRRR